MKHCFIKIIALFLTAEPLKKNNCKDFQFRSYGNFRTKHSKFSDFQDHTRNFKFCSFSILYGTSIGKIRAKLSNSK